MIESSSSCILFVHPDGSVVLLPKVRASVLRGIIKSRRRRPVAIVEMTEAAAKGAAGAAPRATSMIGLDTNILVRFLTQDDPIQSPRATEIIEHRLTEENPGFVSIVTMVETVWVLDRAYGLAANEIAAAVERMLQTDVLVVENEQEVFRAMIALKEGQGSFADAVMAALGTRAGCSCTLTFGQKALRISGFEFP